MGNESRFSISKTVSGTSGTLAGVSVTEAYNSESMHLHAVRLVGIQWNVCSCLITKLSVEDGADARA